MTAAASATASGRSKAVPLPPPRPTVAAPNRHPEPAPEPSPEAAPEPEPEPVVEPEETPQQARASEAELSEEDRKLPCRPRCNGSAFTRAASTAPSARHPRLDGRLARGEGLEPTGILTTRQRAALVDAYFKAEIEPSALPR
jgi:hypothetical protein